jgi:hypothetical protein
MQATTESEEQLLHYYDQMMAGHAFIGETLEAFYIALGELIAKRRRSPRILELGSHAGIISASILERWPSARLVVSDDDESLIALSRRRLKRHDVEYHTGPLEKVAGPLDLVVSVARHHHLPHDYLTKLAPALSADTVYLFADEFCPEYCVGEHLARIEQAEVMRMAGGYVLTSRAEVEDYEASGAIPILARRMETERQRALWSWYRFVVDHAVEHGYFGVAVGELQSTHDDLITGSDAEHKFSPAIVERQFALAGFRRLSKQLVGPSDDPSKQSMFVYAFCLA